MEHMVSCPSSSHSLEFLHVSDLSSPSLKSLFLDSFLPEGLSVFLLPFIIAWKTFFINNSCEFDEYKTKQRTFPPKNVLLTPKTVMVR